MLLEWFYQFFVMAKLSGGVVLRELRVRLIQDAVKRAS